MVFIMGIIVQSIIRGVDIAMCDRQSSQLIMRRVIYSRRGNIGASTNRHDSTAVPHRAGWEIYFRKQCSTRRLNDALVLKMETEKNYGTCIRFTRVEVTAL